MIKAFKARGRRGWRWMDGSGNGSGSSSSSSSGSKSGSGSGSSSTPIAAGSNLKKGFQTPGHEGMETLTGGTV